MRSKAKEKIESQVQNYLPDKSGGQAFPLMGVFSIEGKGRQKGMTLREYYAGEAMAAIISGSTISMTPPLAWPNADPAAELAVEYADALIRRLGDG